MSNLAAKLQKRKDREERVKMIEVVTLNAQSHIDRLETVLEALLNVIYRTGSFGKITEERINTEVQLVMAQREKRREAQKQAASSTGENGQFPTKL